MRPARPLRRAALASLLIGAGAAAWFGAAGAAPARMQIVGVDASPDSQQVTLLAQVQPRPEPPLRSDAFSVSAGGARLPARAAPMVTGSLAVGLVLDVSAEGAAALQPGLSGATNLLLQLPGAARATAVADRDPPTVVAPLRPDPTIALRPLMALPPGGRRATAAALDLVLRQLPAVPAGSGEPRVVLLLTGARDAGGESATDLVTRLHAAHAVFAVVSTAADTSFWSQVTGRTGGVVRTAQPKALIGAFQSVADALGSRYLISFPRPAPHLPARVSVQLNTAGRTLVADAVIPAGAAPAGPSASAAPPSIAGQVGHAPSRRPLVFAIAGPTVLVATAVAVLLLRTRSDDRTRPRRGFDPREKARPVESPPPRSALVAGSAPPAERAAEHAAERPRPAPVARPAWPGPEPADQPEPATQPEPAAQPEPVAPSAADGAVAEPDIRATSEPLARSAPEAPSEPSAAEPVAAERPAVEPVAAGPPAAEPVAAPRQGGYAELDARVADVAAAVESGRLDRARGVAQIALFAPGRIDLLDRLMETELRIAGSRLGRWPPTGTVLELTAAARRVVLGELVLSGPDGVRVEQTVPAGGDRTTRTVLRLTRGGRWVADCTTIDQLAEHVDLSLLAAVRSANAGRR